MQALMTVYFDGEDGPQEEPGSAWVDVATVTVAAKTKRKTVIKKAVALAGDALDMAAAVMMRVIPAEHAVPIKVEMEQPPPQLKIG